MSIIIGLHGCYCHPFHSWEDLKSKVNQKFIKGDLVKHRCLGRIGTILGRATENIYPQDAEMFKVETKFYSIKYGPLASDIQLIHPQNVILIKS